MTQNLRGLFSCVDMLHLIRATSGFALKGLHLSEVLASSVEELYASHNN